MKFRHSLSHFLHRLAAARRHRRPVSGAVVGAAVLLAAVSAAVPTQPAFAEGDLVIRDFVLTRGIYEREPIDVVDAFPSSDDRAFVFARLSNDGLPARVTMVWYYGFETHAEIDLNIGVSPGWRTWSSANLKPGDWRVELVSEGGTVLAERAFTVGPQIQPASGPWDEAPVQSGNVAPNRPNDPMSSDDFETDADG